jgi:asparagine synthase (glutamine-hydrolysing)
MYGEPFADSSQVPTFLVSKLTRSSVTVALSGDGGDELFAGYENYMTVQKHQRLFKLFPRFSLRALAKVLGSSGGQRVFCSTLGERDFTRLAFGANLFSGAESSRQFLSTRLLVKECGSIAPNGTARTCAGNLVEQTMCRDLNAYLPDDILVKVDRASMAVALEARAPFVDDFQVFEMAWSIPSRHKIASHGGKLILKRSLETFLPRHLFERPKQGFAVPLHAWLSGKLKEWVTDCVSPGRLVREGYLDPRRVEFIRQQALGGDVFYNSRLWSICMFQSWLEHVGQSLVASAA